ncbi:MAG TPA: hypothetical protein VGQ44_05235 [Gemmatimonadaceae bacterium]|jgi:hypothetical protein|nr:hypothetical protein [Gemmatimonadaceae bacterium]
MRSLRLALVVPAALLGACTHTSSVTLSGGPVRQDASFNIEPMAKAAAPNPDTRVGLKAGLNDAGQASWNMRLVSTTPTPEQFKSVNSDLGFFGKYALQGTFDGWLVWDVSNPSHPTLRKGYFCPASQNDVSVYKNLLFMSAESESSRLDCKPGGITEPVSAERIRGLRIFDISDLDNPKYITSVQTCRGSHTHTLVVDPKDANNVYVYISGSSGIRPAAELAGCSNKLPESDPNSALFRIEVIKVPLAHPEQASVVSSPRIFNDLTAPAHHGLAQGDVEDEKAMLAQGKFPMSVLGITMEAPAQMVGPLLDSAAKANHGGGPANGADSAAVRAALPQIVLKQFGMSAGADRGPTQCHDITVYPAIGYAGGACEGYGMLLDIHDPAHPVRLDAASDSNFSYWHSATFNNDGTKLLFSDEWGGGSAPKCRASDPRDWGADAIFDIVNNKLVFQGYYKLSAPQTAQENCVAHNGSIIPVPGRDVMVQAWYQGGVSVFDFTDPKHAAEIAFFDRGPIDPNRMVEGGSWSAYWYNGVIVSSEIARGLDVLELTPNPLLTQNELDAAKTAHVDYLNVQGQPRYSWPASFAVARAYVDQLDRSKGLSDARISAVRQALSSAESASGSARNSALSQLASQLDADASGSRDSGKVRTLAAAVRDLAQ